MMLLIEIAHHLGQVRLLNKHALKMSVKSKDAFSVIPLGVSSISSAVLSLAQ